MKVKFVKKGTMKPSKPFKSLEDTHSVLDEINEGTLVGFHRANKTDTITIRFQPEHVQVLKEKALQMGIGPTTLARMWIIEKLKKENKSKNL